EEGGRVLPSSRTHARLLVNPSARPFLILHHCRHRPRARPRILTFSSHLVLLTMRPLGPRTHSTPHTLDPAHARSPICRPSRARG
ncbi:hypothetical protein HETIRDRAFT_317981, partial [Heterobasidion irregulare TC 32-1]